MTKDLANDKGFTLIEVLVSFAILAGVIITAFQVFGDGLNALHVGQSRAIEIESAQLQIDKLSLSKTLSVGTNNVTEGRLKLRIVIAEIKLRAQQQPSLLRPFHVSVFLDDGKQQPEPLLETIVIANSAAP